VDLIPGGREIPVREGERAAYARARATFLLTRGVATSLGAFRRGWRVVAADSVAPTLSLFSPAELQMLVEGERRLDFFALERVARYEGG
jgi:hypothetical protein